MPKLTPREPLLTRSLIRLSLMFSRGLKFIIALIFGLLISPVVEQRGLSSLLGVKYAQAQLRPPPRVVIPPRLYLTDMARGLRFEPPLMCIHFPQNQPDRIYVGNRLGRVYQSFDQGESWLEGSVLTPRTLFLGGAFKHRAAPFDSYGILNEGILPSPGQLFSFRNLLDLNQRLPQVGGLIRSYFNAEFGSDPSVSGFLSSARSGRASSRLHQLTRHRYQLSINWRDPVAERLGQNIEVRSVETSPHHPKQIFVGTGDGLYHSHDGGDSFPISFSGVTRGERAVNVVRVHPQYPQEVWIGTEGGLRISRDAGQTYQAPKNRFVLDSNVRWIIFHPRLPDTVYIATSALLIKSEDRGQTFQFVHYFRFGEINRFFIDPHRPERILLATTDGLLLSTQGGKDFKRIGELLFVGQGIVDITQGFQPGHYFVATRRDLWQSFDGGISWQIAYFGSVDWFIRRIIHPPHHRNEIWVLTSAEILKLSYQAPHPVDPQKYRLLRERISAEPTMIEVISATLKRAGVDRDQRAALRSWARLKNILPEVDAFYVQRDAPVNFVINNFLLKDTGEVTNNNSGSFDYGVWGAVAWWDLHPLIFDVAEVPTGGRERSARQLEERLRLLVINLYQERVSMIASLELDPRNDRVTLMRRLRLEELTAHLNALSGHLFAPFNALEDFTPQP